LFWKPADNNALAATGRARESTVRTETILSTRPRVLLADDYPEILNAVSRLLALECEIVGTVADGSALLEAAQRLQPDVIVLDVNLPNVRSLEACREITRLNPEVKVIMFTAGGDPNASKAFLEAGASAFMSKMASVDLLSTIKRLCVQQG
jgi:DNA-binding NarL/FixJ family response regulator